MTETKSSVYDDIRQRLLEAILAEAKNEGVEVPTVTVYFRNNDVPEFLKRLDTFEKYSRNCNLVICGYNY